MKCPFCKNPDSWVLDSREVEEERVIRRRRECGKCKKRFTTYERVELLNLLVIKKDGRREAYAREKIVRGIMRAAEKTQVSLQQIEDAVTEIEQEIEEKYAKEIESKEIGKMVMKRLKKLDKVTYIRFASVYREFTEPEDFNKELKKITKS